MRIVLSVVFLTILVACGESEEPVRPSSGDDGAPWSTPGTPAAPATAKEVLARVRAQVVSGRALSGATWQQDLESLADLLWQPTQDGLPVHVRQHMQLLQVAGDAGRSFARDAAEVERWREMHPVDLEIYEAFVEASQAGVEGYRGWVEREGARLLQAKADFLQRKFRK